MVNWVFVHVTTAIISTMLDHIVVVESIYTPSGQRSGLYQTVSIHVGESRVG